MPRQAKEFAECPHKDAIQFCPLYVVAHCASHQGPSCIDGKMETAYGVHCAVARGDMDFDGAILALRIVDPRLVAECEFRKMAHDAKQQRERNMRAAGIH